MWVELPRGALKTIKKKAMQALAWKAWPLQLEQETSAELASYRDRAGYGRLGSLISRGHA